MEVPQISVHELDKLIVLKKPFLLLDVREADELEISRLDPCLHIPMDEVPNRIGEIPKDGEVLILCRTGNRSNKIAEFLIEQGYLNVKNIAGGINGYSQEVDDSIAQY